MGGMSRAAAERLLARASERLAELDQVAERFGEEPGQGSIIRLIRDINGYRYFYAIVRAGNGKWFASGARSGRALEGLNWDELARWMAEFDIVHYEVIGLPDSLSPVPLGNLFRQRSARPRPTGQDPLDDYDHDEGSYPG